jgi:hypothetical protein
MLFGVTAVIVSIISSLSEPVFIAKCTFLQCTPSHLVHDDWCSCDWRGQGHGACLVFSLVLLIFASSGGKGQITTLNTINFVCVAGAVLASLDRYGSSIAVGSSVSGLGDRHVCT